MFGVSERRLSLRILAEHAALLRKQAEDPALRAGHEAERAAARERVARVNARADELDADRELLRDALRNFEARQTGGATSTPQPAASPPAAGLTPSGGAG